ncbi:MAG: hypothetical protein J1F36_03470, partial [Clostridiales bacterium]|nr:hypothetical protein [Clostridiales bacterium]
KTFKDIGLGCSPICKLACQKTFKDIGLGCSPICKLACLIKISQRNLLKNVEICKFYGIIKYI